MNRRSLNNQSIDFKETKRICKALDMRSIEYNNEKIPDFDDFTLKTLSQTAINSSWYSEETDLPSGCMKLRSNRGRCKINPFDLSSNCGGEDVLASKYSLRSREKRATSNSSLLGDLNKATSSTIDLESIRWSEMDSFSVSGDIKSIYDYFDEEQENHQLSDQSGLNGNKKQSSAMDLDCDNSKIKKPKLAFCYELRQRHNRNYQNFSHQASPLPIMRDSSATNIYIPEISNQTLSDLLIGRYACYLSDYTIIDCRFPYEYEGGHVMNSINLYTCHQLLQFLIKSSSQLDIEQELYQVFKLLEESPNTSGHFQTNAFIFYCEFSSFRGPKLAQCLRGIDRLANESNHPRLTFPHVFVLHGGFNEFFHKYPQLCIPQGYVSMKQTRYCLRSPINPTYLTTNSSPTKCHNPEQDNSKVANVLTPKGSGDVTSITYRKQQINCQRQLRYDAKRLMDIVVANTKNSDIIRLFKFNEIF